MVGETGTITCMVDRAWRPRDIPHVTPMNYQICMHDRPKSRGKRRALSTHFDPFATRISYLVPNRPARTFSFAEINRLARGRGRSRSILTRKPKRKCTSGVASRSISFSALYRFQCFFIPFCPFLRFYIFCPFSPFTKVLFVKGRYSSIRSPKGIGLTR